MYRIMVYRGLGFTVGDLNHQLLFKQNLRMEQYTKQEKKEEVPVVEQGGKQGKKKPKKAEIEKEKFEPGVYHERSEEEKKVLLDKLIEEGKTNRHQQKYFKEITKEHKFWGDQPTIKWNKKVEKGGAIHEIKSPADVRKDPEELPEGLEWCDINIVGKDTKDMDEFYTLLTENYVEDDGGTFRFDYSREFLRWALTPPSYNAKWHVGIRNKNKELVASITAIPVSLVVEGVKIEMGEVNFLCVHKSLREKKLAPTLIKEVTRRINLKDKWQALYTAGRVLPTPFCQTTYWHRSLNPVKLVDVRFSGIGPKMTKARMAKLYQLPQQPTIPHFRPMTKKDIPAVHKFLNDQLSKYLVRFQFSQDQIRHFFLPVPKVISTFVIGTPQKITDIFSFYSLPSHVMKNDKHNMLNACYSFYNFATSIEYEELIRNALIVAKRQEFDVYNCLDIMNNQSVFENLYFMVGDGHLNYYLYNWALGRESIEPGELATVLV